MPDEGRDHEQELLDDGVPEEALDYCLLHEIANVSMDFGLDFVK